MPSNTTEAVKKPRTYRRKNIIDKDAESDSTNKPAPKKRGRKPKGGKIVSINNANLDSSVMSTPNIILHLRCSLSELHNETSLLKSDSQTTTNKVVPFQFEEQKHISTPFKLGEGNDNSDDNDDNDDVNDDNDDQSKNTYESVNDSDSINPTGHLSTKTINKRLRKLSTNLYTNNISDKKSACFFCTYDFDNPSIYIPMHELNGTYHCYGCFCSPECAAAYLFREQIDTATRFERYHLLNHIYCKIYNHERNIQPAPNPYYVLEKYYGNLSIQQYRQLLKNERLLLVIDKPLTRSLPELHESNSNFFINKESISSSNKYELKRNVKNQTKNEIMHSSFKFG
jgi:hypothetical protein